MPVPRLLPKPWVGPLQPPPEGTSFILVVGPAGSGKTRWLHHHAPREALRASASPHRPLSLWLDLLEQVDHTLETKQSTMQLAFAISQALPERLVLDDLQWMDDDSAQILQILAYEKQIWAASREELNTIPNKWVRTMEDWSFDQVGEYLQTVLRRSDVGDLTEKLFLHSGGNIGTVVASLDWLEQQQVLVYDFASGQWTWPDDVVLADHAVGAQLRHLSLETQHVLAAASFLPGSFHISILQGLIRALGFLEESITHEQLIWCLDAGVSEGFLANSIGSPFYHWSHDSFHQAARSLVQELHGSIRLNVDVARHLCLVCHEQPQMTWVLFATADHVETIPTDMALAELGKETCWSIFYKAGLAASNLSAFAPASQYLQKAVTLTTSDNWEWDYESTIDLYHLASQVEFCIGNVNYGLVLAQEAISHALTLDDEVRANMIMADGLGQQARHQDALTLDYKVLRLLGRSPGRMLKFRLLRKLRKVGREIDRMEDSDFIDMEPMTDPVVKLTCDALAQTIVRAFFCGQKILPFYCVMVVLELSIAHGVSPATAFCYSCYSVMLAGPLNQVAKANRMRRFALYVAAKTEAKAFEARITFNRVVYLDAWRIPLPQTLKELCLGSRAGMESGDFEFGFMCLISFCLYSFASGYPLVATMEECNKVDTLSQQYEVKSIMAMFKPFRQMLQDLIGLTDNPFNWEIEGTTFHADCDASATYGLLWQRLSRMMTAFYLDDVQLAYHQLGKLQNFESDISMVSMTLNMFFAGIVNVAMFRKTGNRQHMRHARRELIRMEKLLPEKGMNVTHKYHILKAEIHAYTKYPKDHLSAKDLYDAAITSSTRVGVVQDTALANELAALFFEKRDRFWASHYACRARDLYESWGSAAKVKQWNSRMGDLLQREERVATQPVSRPTVTSAIPPTVPPTVPPTSLRDDEISAHESRQSHRLSVISDNNTYPTSLEEISFFSGSHRRGEDDNQAKSDSANNDTFAETPTSLPETSSVGLQRLVATVSCEKVEDEDMIVVAPAMMSSAHRP